MVKALAAHGLDSLAAPPPVSSKDPLEERLKFLATAEAGLEALNASLMEDLPPVSGIQQSIETIRGVDSNDIVLYIHRPKVKSSNALPGILHFHGGGMAMLSTSGPMYSRWRDELAATGMVVIGVEFRNAAGVLGPHPFPAGLNDCTTALEWTHANRESLGLSKLILAGESGGANLALATTIKAKREGRLDAIDGVYALVPYISGAYDWNYEDMAAEFPSLLENDGYFVNNLMNKVAASVYDPDGLNANNPLCWPYWATYHDLTGLPPHVITVNELDLYRDEGLGYYRKLAQAGVNVTGRNIIGVCHAAELMFRKAMPDMYLSTIYDVNAFAKRINRKAGESVAT
ncbi:alpha/beta hydrolase [Pueribacillus theae]|uniref:Alpha/beta hydrolase n=2 Tax=Pueribacillus theae TaxID=2171751 RepID=A0A2U1JV19_9BACI|nr:alpha/beta hydrolase [Pueribacillus theae]